MSRISKGFWDLANRLREETEDARSSLKKEEAEEKKNKIKAFVRRSSKKHRCLFSCRHAPKHESDCQSTRHSSRSLPLPSLWIQYHMPYFQSSFHFDVSLHSAQYPFHHRFPRIPYQLFIFPAVCPRSSPPGRNITDETANLFFVFLFPFSPPTHSLPSPVRQSLSIYLSTRIRFCHRIT